MNKIKRLIPVFLILILLSVPSAEVYARPAECNSIEGAKVMAQDETYLGMIENKYSGDSIFNKYGSHGSKYASDSIWNKYRAYGGKYSADSPFNKYTSSPPMIVSSGSVIGYLTIKKYLQGAVDPIVIAVVCFGYEDFRELRP